MDLINMDMVKNGLIAGVIVAIVSVVFLALAWSVIEKSAGAEASGAMNSWLIRWAAISLIFGIGAAVVYNFALGHWNWGMTEYLLLAVGLMIVLDVLAYLPLFDGKGHAFATAWIGLNASFAIGFGYLIPKLAGN